MHAVNQQQLAQTLFPVGELEKSEVRAIAEQQGLITAQKKTVRAYALLANDALKIFCNNTYLPNP